jgi:hypothetical protein
VLRIYIDTSVLGGCFDVEFAPWSNGLMRDFRMRRLVPVLSDVTAAEVGSAPEPVRELHQEILALAGTVLPVTSEVLELVAKYETKGILATKFRADMQHIALATIAWCGCAGELELSGTSCGSRRFSSSTRST